ncbi:MAG: small subunit ribosomal protein S4 [Alphaproteobacteria bacterium]|jgi:small subunit ribosomal protein S4
MSKRHNAKYKIDRVMGENLWGRPKSPINKRKYGPGQHGQNRGKLSDYGIQLRAKQKIKGYYANLNERQFRNVYREATRRKGDTSDNMIGMLEQRLDTVIYRAKFAPTMFAARQFVNHGHILVNGKRLNIPSARISVGDIITIKAGFKENEVLQSAIALTERDVPDYFRVDTVELKAELTRIPTFEEVPFPAQMQPNLVIEFYSR